MIKQSSKVVRESGLNLIVVRTKINALTVQLDFGKPFLADRINACESDLSSIRRAIVAVSERANPKVLLAIVQWTVGYGDCQHPGVFKTKREAAEAASKLACAIGLRKYEP